MQTGFIPCEYCNNLIRVNNYYNHVFYCEHNNSDINIENVMTNVFTNVSDNLLNRLTNYFTTQNNQDTNNTQDTQDTQDTQNNQHTQTNIDNLNFNVNEVFSNGNYNVILDNLTTYFMNENRNYDSFSQYMNNINNNINNINNNNNNYEYYSTFQNVPTGISLDKINKLFPKLPVIEKKDCVICLDTIKHECRELSCSHSFCVECIDKWLTINKKCPLCNKEVEDIKTPVVD